MKLVGFAITILFGLALNEFDTMAQKQGESTSVRQAIDREYAQYIKFFKEANAAGVASVYDKDGSRLYPNGVVIRGQEAVKADLERFIREAGSVKVTLETADLWVVDHLAYETGKWSYTFKPKGRDETTIGGRYVTIWKQQPDGGWKMLADMAVPKD